MAPIGEIVLATLFFISCVLIIYILARYNYLIKKLAAEKGFDPIRNRGKYGFVEIGCMVLSIGIGLGICSIYTTIELPEDTFYFLVYSTLFICGGLGLFAANFTRRKLGERQ